MTNSAPNIPDPALWLSTQITVKRYLVMEAAQDKPGIANFIHNRFVERYLTPLRNVKAGDDNGFLTMGVCCLLIEGLTAFRAGWPTTEGKSKRAFQCFFAREVGFGVFRGIEEDFWKGVRCGILHQGETAKGWRLNFTDRSAPLFEPENKRINCFVFFSQMESVLASYRDELINSDWKSIIWVNLREKMNQTIKDCIA